MTQPASADVDVYITPGLHTVNGRQWSTACERYSSNVERCRTEIWATQIVEAKGRYVTVNGWAFNNLTYKATPRARWITNNIGRSSQWVSDGRDWYTECDTPTTGKNGCRSYIWSTAIQAQSTAKGTKYVKVEGWTFNNMVRFTDDVYASYSGTGAKTLTLPKGLSEAYITVKYTGTDEFGMTVLDTGNEAVDGLVGEGNYSGSTFAGWLTSKSLAKIQMTGKGKWTVTVKPDTAAPKLTGPVSGTWDEAFLYYGPPTKKKVTYTGTGRFQVTQGVGDRLKVVIDTTGPYSGTMTLTDETFAVMIGTDGGKWTIS